MKRTPVSFDEYMAIREIVFEWGDGYDNKDWSRFRNILAPTVKMDYSIVGHVVIENMPAEEVVAMMSAPEFLGDPLVRTQHLMGASKYERISDTEILGYHQIRAAHQRYTGPDHSEVADKGHGHAVVKHWYKKIEGVWKLSGIAPNIYWNEHNFDLIFPGLKVEH
ncbi:hypothetical protein B7463_g567, partial [Scytalidium lignicola]